MMKKLLFILITPALIMLSCSSPNSERDKKYDTTAVENLDKLSEIIGKLNSCSFTLNTMVSKTDGSEHLREHDVYLRGPDKMHIYSDGQSGRKSFWYNGKQFSYFSYTEKVYDVIDAPENIVATIDFVHNKYGIDFPAADFFYPTFTDDILNNYSQVLLLDDEVVNNEGYIVIEALNKNEIVHIWIDKISHLPFKMSIKKENGEDKYYEAIFSNWKINPTLPDLLFEFAPPANSSKKELNIKD